MATAQALSQIAPIPSQVGKGATLLATHSMADGMLKHLGQIARERRREKHVKLVRIGAALDKSEGSLSRFEAGQVWAELESVVSAYAQELGVEPVELWEEAIDRWRREK